MFSRFMWMMLFHLQHQHRSFSDGTTFKVWASPGYRANLRCNSMASEPMWAMFFFLKSQGCSIAVEWNVIGWFPKWLQTSCAKQSNEFKIYVNAILESLRPISKHFRLCICRCVGSIQIATEPLCEATQLLQGLGEWCSCGIWAMVEAFDMFYLCIGALFQSSITIMRSTPMVSKMCGCCS